MVPPGLWVTCSHGVTHIEGDEVILVYGSCGVTAQGPTFGPQGRPVPSQDEMKPLQTLPPSSFYLKPLPTSSHTLYVPILPHAPVSHLQPTSCFLLNSILLLQPISSKHTPREPYSSSRTFSDSAHFPHRQAGPSQASAVPSRSTHPPLSSQ